MIYFSCSLVYLVLLVTWGGMLYVHTGFVILWINRWNWFVVRCLFFKFRFVGLDASVSCICLWVRAQRKKRATKKLTFLVCKPVGSGWRILCWRSIMGKYKTAKNIGPKQPIHTHINICINFIYWLKSSIYNSRTGTVSLAWNVVECIIVPFRHVFSWIFLLVNHNIPQKKYIFAFLIFVFCFSIFAQLTCSVNNNEKKKSQIDLESRLRCFRILHASQQRQGYDIFKRSLVKRKNIVFENANVLLLTKRNNADFASQDCYDCHRWDATKPPKTNKQTIIYILNLIFSYDFIHFDRDRSSE